MGVKDLPTGGGVDEVNVPFHKLAEGVTVLASRIASEQFRVIVHGEGIVH
jgi:hypothetical protein